ncbi:hypothetical protein F2Q69_00063553 [Brassica cretica]|uniref:MLO-like protein n=1 Tax=Brassica cretica TaxID=69181 RepID=A0A8S9RP07_BRACR|nr:hypothetical protein F2Q69_00063553 [Brassica cretica]
MEHMMKEGRSLAETPTYSVASVVTVLVFVCFLVERAIYRFGKVLNVRRSVYVPTLGKWLKKTRRKALFTSLEKMKEELMLLGLISLLLSQSARWISEICVNSSLFNSKFYICSEQDYGIHKKLLLEHTSSTSNTSLPHHGAPHQCGHGREPFVSYEGLEQLLRFLFVLGITHVLYSGIAIGLAMSKIYSWRKWEAQAIVMAEADIHGLNMYFWLSFIPAILVMLVGTKLEHVVSKLALEMGSRCKKAVIAENVRDSLHSWCKRVKERSKHARSVCSLDTATIDERDEMTVGTLSRSSSMTSLNQITINSTDQAESIFGAAASSSSPQDEYTSRVEEYLSETFNNIGSMQPLNDEIEIEVESEEDNERRGSESEETNGEGGETLFDLFRRT